MNIKFGKERRVFVQNKSNLIFISVIFVLLIACIYLKQYFDFGNAIYLMLGFAFMLLYKNKKQIWALVPGIYLFYIGIINTCSSLGLNTVSLLIAMFFIVPSIIYMIKFYECKNLKLIKPMCRLFFIGIFIILYKVVEVEFYNLSITMISCFLIGICLITEYSLGKGYFSNSRLAIGAIFIMIALFKLLF